MGKIKTDTLFLILMGVVVLLMLMNVDLFLRMNQLQGQVLQALQPLQRPTGLPVGTQAPAFTLTDPEGRMMPLVDWAGQRLLLAFSSTQCPACQAMYPHLKAFSEGNQGIRVVMVSRGSVEENRALVTEQGLGFPMLTWDDAVAGEYQVPGTPFFYVIDQAGVIVNAGFASTLAQLEALVETGGE